MATYFVSAGGSSTAPYSSWATAATSLQTALTTATTDGDIIVIQYNNIPSVDTEVSVATTYTIAAKIKIVSATNGGGTAYTPTAMGTSYWIGNSTASRSITISGSYSAYIYGITIRTAGLSTSNINIGVSDNMQVYLENCYIWQGNTASSPTTRMGPGGSNSTQTYIKLKNCTLRFSNVGHDCRIAATVDLEDCNISSAGTAISDIFRGSDSSDPGGAVFTAIGCDFSAAASGANLVADTLRPVLDFKFIQCKLPTSYVTLAAQTSPNKSAARVWVYDCSEGDTHGLFEYADGLGSIVMDTGVYYTSTPSILSWKIVTNSYCSDITPFETPWIDFYNLSASSITPRFEILREGSSTAFTNAEVWADFFIKNTSGTTKSTLFSDKVAFGGSPTNQTAGAGLASWTGEGTPSWSGKIDSGSAVAPVEIGMIKGRVGVAIASTTLYVDPYIRTV